MKKMLLSFSFLMGLQIAYTQQKSTSVFFEGYIEYKTEFKSLMQGVSDNEIRERVGNFIKIYFAESDVKWVFSDDAGFIRSYVIFDLKKSMHYSWSDDVPDTIYSFNLNSKKRIETDSIIENGVEEILGCKCQISKIISRNNYEKPDYSIPTIYYYSFCPILKINPEPYRNFKEMRWDEIIEKYKSAALKMVTKFGDFFMATFTATAFKTENIDNSIFLIDKTKIIKPTFVD